MHLTAGWLDPSLHNRLDLRGQRDVFGNVVHAFQNPLLVVIYLVGQVVLGLHLSHALSSSLQTLGHGASDARSALPRRRAAGGAAGGRRECRNRAGDRLWTGTRMITLDSKVPSGPLDSEMGPSPFQ